MVKTLDQTNKTYMWYEMNYFSQWSSSRCTVLCTGAPDLLRTLLAESLSGQREALNFSDAYSMHVPLMDGIIALYDKSVWTLRDSIRHVEKVFHSIPPTTAMTALAHNLLHSIALSQHKRASSRNLTS